MSEMRGTILWTRALWLACGLGIGLGWWQVMNDRDALSGVDAKVQESPLPDPLPTEGPVTDSALDAPPEAAHMHAPGSDRTCATCAAEKQTQAAAAEIARKLGIPNTVCPVTGDLLDDDARAIEWRGVRMGVCCEHCEVEWAWMTDAQRLEVLAAAGIPVPGDVGGEQADAAR